MIKSTSWVSMLQDEGAKILKIGDLLVLPDCGIFSFIFQSFFVDNIGGVGSIEMYCKNPIIFI